MQQKGFSFFGSAWKRLRKNKGAMWGLITIALAVLIAIFAYMIAPDGSPDANLMTVEISGQKPGYKMDFLKIKRFKPSSPGFALSSFFSGSEDGFQYLPIVSWKMRSDSIEVMKFVDEGISEKQVYALVDCAKAPVERKRFLLGTDKFGRDILSRLIVGVRVSLGVGLIAVAISLTIGIFLGAVAGYFRGRIDDWIMWLINVVWSIPTLLLVFAITLVLGKGFWQVFIAVGLTLWVNVARIIRGQVMGIRELEYVEAARALGFPHARILFRHILPNVLGPVMVIAASNFASAIVIEAGLSFLGVGVQSPQPSWGLMIKENYNFIITHNPLLAIAPGICIMILVLAFNLLGSGLRDALDVRGRE
jgi:peptide/nickel transport system permease protein